MFHNHRAYAIKVREQAFVPDFFVPAMKQMKRCIIWFSPALLVCIEALEFISKESAGELFERRNLSMSTLTFLDTQIAHCFPRLFAESTPFLKIPSVHATHPAIWHTCSQLLSYLMVKMLRWLVPRLFWKGTAKFGIRADLKCCASRKTGAGSANGNYGEHQAGGCSSIKIRSGRQFIKGQPNNLLDPQTSTQAGHFGQTQGQKPAGLPWLWFSSLADGRGDGCYASWWRLAEYWSRIFFCLED